VISATPIQKEKKNSFRSVLQKLVLDDVEKIQHAWTTSGGLVPSEAEGENPFIRYVKEKLGHNTLGVVISLILVSVDVFFIFFFLFFSLLFLFLG